MANSADWQLVGLQQRPDYLEQLAGWHHNECLRQGVKSELAVRQERLERHLVNAHKVPQTWLALTDSNTSNKATLIGCVSVVSYHLGAQPNSPDADTPDADTPLWLSNLYVEPAWRRRGVAGSLMTQVISFAAGLGMNQLWLTATDQADFYQRRGWSVARRAQLGGRWVSVMSLALGDTP